MEQWIIGLADRWIALAETWRAGHEANGRRSQETLLLLSLQDNAFKSREECYICLAAQASLYVPRQDSSPGGGGLGTARKLVDEALEDVLGGGGVLPAIEVP